MWAEDIVDHLVAAGVGTAGTDLYWGILPDKPESCGAVIPYPGLVDRSINLLAVIMDVRSAGWAFNRKEVCINFEYFTDVR